MENTKRDAERSTINWDLMSRQFEAIATAGDPIPHILAMWPQSKRLPTNEYGYRVVLRSQMHPFESGFRERELRPDPREGVVKFEWWSPINDGTPIAPAITKLGRLFNDAAASMRQRDAGPVWNLSNERRRWTASLHFVLKDTCNRFAFPLEQEHDSETQQGDSEEGWFYIDPPLDANLLSETDLWRRDDLIIDSFLSQYCNVRPSPNSRPRFGMMGIVLPDNVIGVPGKVIYSVLDDVALASAMACKLLATASQSAEALTSWETWTEMVLAQQKLTIRRQIKAEKKTDLTDDIFVAAYRQCGSYRSAARYLSNETGQEISKDAVGRAVNRAGGVSAALNSEDSDSIVRGVASQRRDKKGKNLRQAKPTEEQ